MAERVVILANGILPAPERARRLLRPEDILIGADGGTHYLLDWGLRPHEVIGDLDSLPEMTIEALRRDGVSVQRYPRDKDETDLELALRHALRYQPSSILILAAFGLRLDQTIANVALLTVPWLEGVNVRLDDGVEEAFFVRHEGVIRGDVGDTVSLIPWGQPVEGIHTEGLRWSLRGETLYPGTTRGISNELIRVEACVRVRSGLLLVTHRRLLRTGPPSADKSQTRRNYASHNCHCAACAHPPHRLRAAPARHTDRDDPRLLCSQ